MNDKQREALQRVCENFHAEFKEEHYSPEPFMDGWFGGWIGGVRDQNIYVGVSPEGEVHS